MTPAEFFKNAIAQRKYRAGVYMCHVIEDTNPRENWPVYKGPINNFMRELDQMGYDDRTDLFFESIALTSALSRAVGRVVSKKIKASGTSEQVIGEQLERLGDARLSDVGERQVWDTALSIYGDWDKRWVYVNNYIESLSGQI